MLVRSNKALAHASIDNDAAMKRVQSTCDVCYLKAQIQQVLLVLAR